MKFLTFFSLFLLSLISKAQTSGGTMLTKAQPITDYVEKANPAATDAVLWNRTVKGSHIGWGSTNVRYQKEVPYSFSSGITLEGWKGERVSAQFVVSNNSGNFSLSYEFSPLQHQQNRRHIIGKNRIDGGFVRYVMTDELNKDRKGACGYRKAKDYDSSLVADPIDHLIPHLAVTDKTTQGVWMNIHIPQDAEPGTYSGTVTVKKNGKAVKKLPLQLRVINHTLPPASEWNFHLDLWQNPYAVARYYNVRPWSTEHFEALKTEMQPYVQAGGKVITASIMHKPWGGQTYDYFESMVTWTKKLDGTWAFDFAVFDKWVQFMMDMGVNKQINCYSMVPWKLSFQYFDQATNSMQFISTEPGKKEYEEMWGAMLRAFSKHLKEKGWFGKTYISMDERPLDTMLKTYEIIKKADKDFKVSLAGALHEELIDKLDDYCVALRMKYKEEDIVRRRAEGKVTTFYTSCEEPFPNTFTFSNPAESEWMGWYAAKANLDGYLRWAYNSWVEQPLQDSRFRTWAAGDTYFTYPGGRSSVRFEKLAAGIQAYEKIRILIKFYRNKGDREGLKKIEAILSQFDEAKLTTAGANIFTESASRELNKL